jgi:hypothetical protein
MRFFLMGARICLKGMEGAPGYLWATKLYLALLGLVLGTTAPAQIVYFPLSSPNIALGGNQSGDGFFFVNLLTGETSIAGFTAGTPTLTVNVQFPFNSTQDAIDISGASSQNGFVSGGGSQTALLAAGTVIGPVSDFGGHYLDPQWPLPSSGFVGFYFLNPAITGSAYYGWAAVERGANRDVHISAIAWNSVAGESILAGQTSAIPEPSTYATIAGASALFGAWAWRRRAPRALAGS